MLPAQLIFMIDGRNDNRGLREDGEYDVTRDWFYQNVRLKDALTEKGYDVAYAWGIGAHTHDPRDTAERSFREAE